MNTRRYISLIAVTLITGLLAVSCTTDYSCAKSFLNKHRRGSASATEKIYVCLPKEVVHTNTSLNEVTNFPYLTERQQDSVIASLTALLDKIDDSVFLSQFSSALLYTISRTNVPIVLVDDETRLPKASEQVYTLNIPQLEAEEFLQKRRSDFSTRNGVYYAYDYDLRHFSANAWFEFGGDSSVYFKNLEIAETFKGSVKKLSQQEKKATIDGHFNRIGLNNVYQTARDLGTLCGTLYVERVLTQYIRSRRGSNSEYFYYLPKTNDIGQEVPYKEGMAEGFDKLSQ